MIAPFISESLVPGAARGAPGMLSAVLNEYRHWGGGTDGCLLVFTLRAGLYLYVIPQSSLQGRHWYLHSIDQETDA